MRSNLEVPKAVRRLIERRGMTITMVAKMSKISRSHLTRALSGKAELSTPQWLRLYGALDLQDAIVAACVEVIDGA